MVYLNKVIPATHELTKSLRVFAKGDDPPTKEQIQQWYTLSKAIAKFEHERLFVIMTAQAKGWNFAKDLDFFQEGTVDSQVGVKAFTNLILVDQPFF